MGKRRFASILAILTVILFAGATTRSTAHPLGGVLQKTILTDMTNAVLIEYDTHIGSQVVLTLHPDKDFNGILDRKERAQFLDRVDHLLAGNISCWLGKKKLSLQEMGRSLSLVDPRDFKNGLNTRFVWRVPLPMSGKNASGLFRMRDNNFQAGEMNQLNYFATVLGNTGPMTLADGGRELIWNISDTNLISSGRPASASRQSSPVADSSVVIGQKLSETGRETGILKSLFRNSPASFGLYLLGFLIAFVLGAFHALSPGHGKSMVAAYLMGSRGRVVDAVRLGLIVTLTHILSVVVLGLLALVLSRYTLSGNVFPWLGVASGVLIFATGYYLLARMAFATDRTHHDHHHGHEPHHHPHQQEPHGHQHGHEHGHSLKEIFSLGIAGGLVPCPSAIVILLFAIAVNRIVTGLLIILCFSLGLASVLILIGILTVTASQRLKQFGSGMNWVRRLPVFSAGIIMVLGVVIGINALFQAGILRFSL